jgi:hypothetical protein
MYWLFIYLGGAVLEFELRASHLLGSYSFTWAMPQPFFAWIDFQIGSHGFAQSQPQAIVIHLPLTSLEAGIRGVNF